MKKKIVFIIVLIFLYFFTVQLTGQRYKKYLPTINFLYPNSNKEVNEVIRATNNRNQRDIDYFYMTDPSVVPAFKPYVPSIPESVLLRVCLSQNDKISLLKNFINRPRPKQLSNKVKLLKSQTAATPAFPAGHAAQAYILANYLQKIYPQKKKLFEKIADRCNDCRIKAGLHYPSDGMYSKLIFYEG